MKLSSFLLSLTLSTSALAQVERGSAGENLAEFLQPYDANQDGALDVEERQAKRYHKMILRLQQRNSLDANDDGITSRDEIIAVREFTRKQIQKRRRERFNEVAGEDNVISLEELLVTRGFRNLPEETILAIFARLDADENGEVSFEEFTARLRSHHRRTKAASSSEASDESGN